MLAYFKDTSAKILRVQISKCTDAIPQATPQASPRKRPLVAEPRGGPLTTAQSAAPAAPKQRQKCTRQRKRYTHIAPPPPTRPRTVLGCLGQHAPVGAARPLGSPVPPRRRRATHTRRGGGAGRVIHPARVVAIPRATRSLAAAPPPRHRLRATHAAAQRVSTTQAAARGVER